MTVAPAGPPTPPSTIRPRRRMRGRAKASKSAPWPFSRNPPESAVDPCPRRLRRQRILINSAGVGARLARSWNARARWGMLIRRILIMGLPGAGKTTLANALAPLLNAVVFNADAVRANLSRDLGFTHPDRVEHARRMGWMCDRVVEAGGTVIADFICPTAETRAAFGDAFTIWVDRICGALRGHQSDVRCSRARRPSGRRRRYAAILGRAGARSVAPSVRPAEAYGLVHRTLPAVSSRASAADRRGSAARRPGVHRHPRHPRHRREESIAVFRREAADRGRAFGLYRPLRHCPAPQHHQR